MMQQPKVQETSNQKQFQKVNEDKENQRQNILIDIHQEQLFDVPADFNNNLIQISNSVPYAMTCNRCSKILSDYVTLSCEHNFCLECMAISVLKGEGKVPIQSENGVDGIEMTCFSCKMQSELGYQSTKAIIMCIQMLMAKYEQKQIESQNVSTQEQQHAALQISQNSNSYNNNYFNPNNMINTPIQQNMYSRQTESSNSTQRNPNQSAIAQQNSGQPISVNGMYLNANQQEYYNNTQRSNSTNIPRSSNNNNINGIFGNIEIKNSQISNVDTNESIIKQSQNYSQKQLPWKNSQNNSQYLNGHQFSVNKETISNGNQIKLKDMEEDLIQYASIQAQKGAFQGMSSEQQNRYALTGEESIESDTNRVREPYYPCTPFIKTSQPPEIDLSNSNNNIQISSPSQLEQLQLAQSLSPQMVNSNELNKYKINSHHLNQSSHFNEGREDFSLRKREQEDQKFIEISNISAQQEQLLNETNHDANGRRISQISRDILTEKKCNQSEFPSLHNNPTPQHMGNLQKKGGHMSKSTHFIPQVNCKQSATLLFPVQAEVPSSDQMKNNRQNNTNVHRSENHCLISNKNFTQEAFHHNSNNAELSNTRNPQTFLRNKQPQFASCSPPKSGHPFSSQSDPHNLYSNKNEQDMNQNGGQFEGFHKQFAGRQTELLQPEKQFLQKNYQNFKKEQLPQKLQRGEDSYKDDEDENMAFPSQHQTYISNSHQRIGMDLSVQPSSRIEQGFIKTDKKEDSQREDFDNQHQSPQQNYENLEDQGNIVECQFHPLEEVSVCCFTCESTLLCLKCVQSGEHKGHEISSMNKSLEQLAGKMGETAHEIRASIELLLVKQKRLQEKQRECNSKILAVKQQIQINLRGFRESLNNKEHELLTQAEEMFTQKQSNLEREIQDIKEKELALTQLYNQFQVIASQATNNNNNNSLKMQEENYSQDINENNNQRIGPFNSLLNNQQFQHQQQQIFQNKMNNISSTVESNYQNIYNSSTSGQIKKKDFSDQEKTNLFKFYGECKALLTQIGVTQPLQGSPSSNPDTSRTPRSPFSNGRFNKINQLYQGTGDLGSGSQMIDSPNKRSKTSGQNKYLTEYNTTNTQQSSCFLSTEEEQFSQKYGRVHTSPSNLSPHWKNNFNSSGNSIKGGSVNNNPTIKGNIHNFHLPLSETNQIWQKLDYQTHQQQPSNENEDYGILNSAELSHLIDDVQRIKQQADQIDLLNYSQAKSSSTSKFNRSTLLNNNDTTNLQNSPFNSHERSNYFRNISAHQNSVQSNQHQDNIHSQKNPFINLSANNHNFNEHSQSNNFFERDVNKGNIRQGEYPQKNNSTLNEGISPKNSHLQLNEEINPQIKGSQLFREYLQQFRNESTQPPLPQKQHLKIIDEVTAGRDDNNEAIEVDQYTDSMNETAELPAKVMSNDEQINNQRWSIMSQNTNEKINSLQIKPKQNLFNHVQSPQFKTSSNKQKQGLNKHLDNIFKSSYNKFEQSSSIFSPERNQSKLLKKEDIQLSNDNHKSQQFLQASSKKPNNLQKFFEQRLSQQYEQKVPMQFTSFIGNNQFEVETLISKAKSPKSINHLSTTFKAEKISPLINLNSKQQSNDAFQMPFPSIHSYQPLSRSLLKKDQRESLNFLSISANISNKSSVGGSRSARVYPLDLNHKTISYQSTNPSTQFQSFKPLSQLMKRENTNSPSFLIGTNNNANHPRNQLSSHSHASRTVSSHQTTVLTGVDQLKKQQITHSPSFKSSKDPSDSLFETLRLQREQFNQKKNKIFQFNCTTSNQQLSSQQ